MKNLFVLVFLAGLGCVAGCSTSESNESDLGTPAPDAADQVESIEADTSSDCGGKVALCEDNVASACVEGVWTSTPCGTKAYCNFGACEPSSFILPQDGAPHDDIIEWWYYTGHLTQEGAEGGKEFGFELALFQQDLADLLHKPVPQSQRFGFMCHIALLDKDLGQHAYTQGIATKINSWSSDPIDLDVLNCHIELSGDGHDHIVGSIPEGQEKKGLPGEWRFDLEVDSLKPVAHHGLDGIIPMAAAGDSYYYSYTRMEAAGQVISPEGTFQVKGQAWMDHQWGNFQTMHFKGWDWWSMQFEDGWEIMLFQFRDWDDVLVEQSGTLVDPEGNSIPLDGLNAFSISSLRTWSSTETDGIYPLDWDITIKELDWNLQIRVDHDAQEMPNMAKNYWEGAVRIGGTRSGTQVKGLGYVELTGYATDIMSPK